MMLYDDMVTEVSVAVAELTDGTANGSAVDRAVNGGMQSAVLVATAGTITDGSHAVSIEDSDDGSTGWAEVDSSQIEGDLPTLTSAESDSVTEVGVRSTRRYVRAVVATTGSTTGGVIGVNIALDSPRFGPVSH